MANNSIYAAFERMWGYITSALNNKSDKEHTHEISEISNLQGQLDGMCQVQFITWEEDD